MQAQVLALPIELDYEQERNKPMPSFNHGLIQANLIFLLKSLYRNQFSFVSEHSMRLEGWPSVPDISIFKKRKADWKRDIIESTEPPLCTIEILSPRQSFDLLREKAEQYFEKGVQSCWIVLPSMGNIYVFSSPDEYEIYRSHEILKDEKMSIELPLAEVFEEN